MKHIRDKKEFEEFKIEISNQFEKADVELLGFLYIIIFYFVINIIIIFIIIL
jgi:hypothetical protein